MTFITMVGFSVFLLLAIELAAYLLIRSLSYIATQEFPSVSAALVKKFASFDSELGHLPIPNSVTFDQDITGKAYAVKCNYNSDGARSSLYAPDLPAILSSFGDSFCQCRGVEDEFTWQRGLEKKLRRPVRNYGVGGYGLDQAYLRYLRLRTMPLGKLILFAVSPCTIERMVGIYKHYIEFGNVLGLKPRYRLKNDGNLDLLKLPIKNAIEIQNLSRYRAYLREGDENYKGYFTKHSARFPFSLFFLNHRIDFLHALTKVLVACLKRSQSMKAWAENLQTTYAEISRQASYERKNSYFEQLYREHQNLFVEVVRQIVNDCNNDGRKVALLFLPDFTNVCFMRSNGIYYRPVLDRIGEELQVTVIDTYNAFNNSDPKLMYLKDNFSGHHTALGNSIVSDIVYAALKPLFEEIQHSEDAKTDAMTIEKST